MDQWVNRNNRKPDPGFGAASSFSYGRRPRHILHILPMSQTTKKIFDISKQARENCSGFADK
jgi:hypothetical protein